VAAIVTAASCIGNADLPGPKVWTALGELALPLTAVDDVADAVPARTLCGSVSAPLLLATWFQLIGVVCPSAGATVCGSEISGSCGGVGVVLAWTTGVGAADAGVPVTA
jgi:hypothetical protein